MNLSLTNKYKPFLSLVLIFASTAASFAQHDPVQPFKGKIGKTIEETEQWWQKQPEAPKGAPNVVWILLDDVGFGATSAFGGLIQTPNFEKLANNGLRYTNFHTTGICSPTRAALLTGRNAHSVGMGHHAELGIGTPGYNGNIPFEAGTVAEIFKENGYNTFALGKWHGNQPKDLTIAGPYNRYPTGRGFEHFYGFLGGATDQWHPQLVEETSPVDIEPNTKHLNQLLTDKTISYIANQKSADADKPFFIYYATGAAHAPHHVSKEWSDKYKGKFDGGWDQYREEVFKRQVALGLVPKGTKLPPRQTGIKPWETLSADEKKIYARFMEVYAGFLSYTDYEVGRVTDYLQQIGQLDNTLIFLIVGDNGGSKEGTYKGTAGIAEKSEGDDVKFLLSQYDKIGTEYSYPNYPLGWSQATNTPFRYWKSDVNAEGASHTTLIVHYPKGIKEKGGLRAQYTHVTDILPTTIELANLKVPEVINGYAQRPFHGTSLNYSIADAGAPTRHTLQYYELHGGRSIYKDGWKASVYHPRNVFGETTTDINFIADFKRDKWELYNLNEDYNEINDLAAKNPEKLEELKKIFDQEAQKYDVYPLRNFRAGLAAPEVKTKSVIYEGTTIKTRIYVGKGAVTITANVDINSKNPEGVIFANGGLIGGTSLFVKDNKLQYLLNDGVHTVLLTSSKNLNPGKNTIKIEFADDTKVALYVNNEKAAEQSINNKNNKYLSSASADGFSVGKDLNSPVTKTYNGSFAFSDAVKSLVIDQVVEKQEKVGLLEKK
ncbi:arylsulfatase [Dyadobacter subterraneus]|uniref:Sulfatase-like hydrolase/transferase n=1 Tax=Dyadobacter subterraneus TaxID=2773304 RepID=A0ABR9WFK2_9BACT|nr:arylsulfatase [Dyadobacter subterraneus]MBE9463914.1 sulfatase-like hydrolase/transferase [Dyadobacter subterraneus]